MELSLTIDQSKSHLTQVAEQLETKQVGNIVRLPQQYGSGYVRQMAFPGGLKIHHYHFNLHQPILLRSLIPKEVRTYLLSIDLSAPRNNEDPDNGELGLNLNQGCFFYSPGIEAFRENPAGHPIDLLTLTFPETFLEYFTSTNSNNDGFSRFIQSSPKFCVFEDLDLGLENLLRGIISDEEPGALEKMEIHLQIIEFLLGVFKKVSYRKEGSSALHPDDLHKLFMISSILKSNLHGSPPSIDQLAREAGMSASKLKRGFKQVFGIPPYQYYLKAKMAEARILLQSKRVVISEVGHLLGYSNLSKFSQAFKKEFGMTPRQYRGTIGT